MPSVNKIIVTVEDISNLEATWYEEDSYGFLLENQSSDWHVYDSDKIGLDAAKTLANNFMALHGVVYFPQKNELIETFWTSIPLGVFRYKMLANGLPYLVDSYKDVPGYIVEGVYWVNGFVYLVKDNNSIIQIKLFIDSKTKSIQLYPDM